jgi:thiamine-phosphate pyrophosphorylase
MAQIYLISPPQIELKDFSLKLEKALKTGLVPSFQLRLKNYSQSEIKKISQEIKKICDNNNCLFLLNDFYEIALEVGASGVHVGIDDKKISQIRQNSPKNFVIGASCYDSKHLAMEAGEQGADYISFGAFFETQTKISRGKPTVEILNWASEILNLPIVAIGGINNKNCVELVKNGADFLAVISYVWQHPEGVEVAIKNLHQQL